jgi:hypothetical protein
MFLISQRFGLSADGQFIVWLHPSPSKVVTNVLSFVKPKHPVFPYTVHMRAFTFNFQLLTPPSCGRATPPSSAAAATSAFDVIGNEQGKNLPPHPSPRQRLGETFAAKRSGYKPLATSYKLTANGQ